MKKTLFIACFFAAASAFAIFIPLQKDGSVRWKSDANGYATVAGTDVAVPVESGTRMPAGQNKPDPYIDLPEDDYNPPDDTPPPEDDYTPPPQHEDPPPSYDGNYSCLKAGFAKAGYKKVSSVYINAVAAKADGFYKGQKSGGFLFFGGKVDPEKNYKKSLKAAIFNLAALGPCNTKGLSPNIPNGAVIKNYSTPWNPDGIRHIRSSFTSRTMRTNAGMYRCVKTPQQQSTSRAICRAMIQTCNEMVCGKGVRNCGIASITDCDYKEEEHHSGGGDGGGSDHGGPSGPGPSGPSGPGPSGPSGPGPGTTGEHETGPGSNAESGHGSDGSNNGAGQGDGPPGS
jgi:hypothetical protein